MPAARTSEAPPPASTTQSASAIKGHSDISLGNDRPGYGRGLRRSHLHDVACSDHAVGLLDLQVGKATHRLGRPRAFVRLVEVAPVTLRRALQAVLEIDVVQVGLDALELRERPLLRDARRACRERRQGNAQCRDIAFPSSTSTRAWDCVARS